MLLMGDEVRRTQRGNNNAYCQDNEISWVHWNHDDREQRLINFVKKLIGLRHQFPILRRARFLSGEYNEDLGVKDVTWINTGGEEMKVVCFFAPATNLENYKMFEGVDFPD